jgi:Arylsulfatase regulator (Fe-S oxidoreductase)
MQNELKWLKKSNLNLPIQTDYKKLPNDFDPKTQTSIEKGFFVFTMMPSLRCSLNCPHCYLTKEQRRNSPIMTLEQLELACKKVHDYYKEKTDIKQKVIIFYWYGGEPTELGQEYMLSAFEKISSIFLEEDGYYIRHEILTSLISIDSSWFDVFKTWGRGHFQTSFDGLMRGKTYVKRWEQRVKEAISNGLAVSTISVVNRELMKDGPRAVLEYLSNLNIEEASFLPFMLNEQNKGLKYEKLAPPMEEYSNFMIELTTYWYERKKDGLHVPHIGQMSYIAAHFGGDASSNIAGQTMFLLPEGDFVLPDYRDGYLEYMKPFGNILSQSFKEVINSPLRREYIRKQYTRNYNSECQNCDFQNNCIMEFWKENRKGDDCFGAKKYVAWLNKMEDENKFLQNEMPILF